MFGFKLLTWPKATKMATGFGKVFFSCSNKVVQSWIGEAVESCDCIAALRCRSLILVALLVVKLFAY